MGITRLVLIALAAIWWLAGCNLPDVKFRQELEITREGGPTRQGVEGDGEGEAPDRSEGRRRNGVGSAAPNR